MSKPLYFHMAPLMEHWISGRSLDTLSAGHEFDQGEVVRNFRMVIQLLRQIQNSRVSSETLVNIARAGVRLVKRGIVDAEWQLRTGAAGPGPEQVSGKKAAVRR